MNDPVRDGIQAALEDSGWVLAHYVCVAAFQRVDSDENLESTTMLFTEGGQGSYITDGLLMQASRLNDAEIDEEAEGA